MTSLSENIDYIILDKQDRSNNRQIEKLRVERKKAIKSMNWVAKDVLDLQISQLLTVGDIITDKMCAVHIAHDLQNSIK